MSEYWKSLPRKFCEACKCWFADNKASIDFHERGKRHQECVKARLETLRKKGQKDYQEKQKYDRTIQRIEKEALKAFQKDLKNDQVLKDNCKIDVSIELAKVTANEIRNTAPKGKKKQGRNDPAGSYSATNIPPTTPPPVKATKVKIRSWYQAANEEGLNYYWNSETGDTQWEEPKEFVSLIEQEKQKAANEAAKNYDNDIGPQMKVEPYGQWTTIVKKVEEPIDWELPIKYEEEPEEIIDTIPEEVRNRFKEKTISTLDLTHNKSENTAFFKKRKNLGVIKKRNVRQRLDEED